MIPPYYRSAAGYDALMGWYERAFSRLNVRLEALCLPTQFGETHVIAAGDPEALPVFLLHGINTNAAVWRPQLAELSREFRVYAPDIVGFAGRSAFTRLPYRGNAYSQWALDVMDELGIESAHIVGSSAGGFFALKLASHVPERVLTVTLLNPCGLASFRFPYNLTLIPGVAALLNGLTPHFMASEKMARRLVGKGSAANLLLDEERVEFSHLILQHYRRYRPPGMVSAGELRRIEARVLLLFSANEAYTEPIRAIQRAKAHIRHLTARLIPGAGHDLNIDRAADVNRWLTTFFNAGFPVASRQFPVLSSKFSVEQV